MGIAENYRALKQEISSSVTLIPAVKYASSAQIKNLLSVGCKDVGFNTLQQLEEVSKLINDYVDVKIHFIGHLQSNKIKKVLDYKPYLIQTVDSFSLAEKIALVCREKNMVQNILLQVKTDPTKEQGFLTEEVLKMAITLHRSPRLRVMGLMTIPSPENPLPVFKLMKKLFDELQLTLGRVEKLPYLSMGMSDDYRLAIQEGATMIRVGRKLFAK